MIPDSKPTETIVFFDSTQSTSLRGISINDDAGLGIASATVVIGGLLKESYAVKRAIEDLTSKEMFDEPIKAEYFEPPEKYKPSKGKKDKFSRLNAIQQARKGRV